MNFRRDYYKPPHSHKAFTLVELLVVVAVLALLASIVFSNLTGAREQAKISNALSFQSQTHSLLGADLVAWWKLDGDVKDISGNNYNGTVSGSFSWVDGITGKALRRSGTITHPPTLYSGISLSGDFSYGGWFKIPSVNDSSNTQRLIGEGTFTKALGVIGPTLRYGNHDENSTSVNISSFQNNWHHYFVSNDDGVYSLFIDGKFIQSVSGHRTEINITNVGGMTYEVEMSDIRIYNSSLSSSEIQTLYAQTKDKYLADMD